MSTDADQIFSDRTEFITCACATHWRRQYELHFSLAGQVGMAMHLGEQDSNCESLVVSQNFVLCQDGLTPCHLMLSLSGCHRLRVKSAVEINMSNLDPSSQCASLPYEPLLAKVAMDNGDDRKVQASVAVPDPSGSFSVTGPCVLTAGLQWELTLSPSIGGIF
ncbi:uncharacterized protein LOC142587398 isoform X3 [Dermacentor variabilis]|uniref:uncharacterized protein LOC142587398 isoform X3 n=1 Tax=Dermacentor variabilis TaxID=34621 RepID=UPI003F5B0B3F